MYPQAVQSASERKTLDIASDESAWKILTVQAIWTPLTSLVEDPPIAFKCHPRLLIASPTSRTFTSGSLDALYGNSHEYQRTPKYEESVATYKAMTEAGGDPMMYNGGTESVIR